MNQQLTIRLIRACGLAAVAMSSACSASDTKASDTHAIVASTATLPGGAPRYTVADLGRLRWLAGDWRGRTQDGTPSYMRVRIVDDSTFRTSSFSDSTFRVQKDSATVSLRDGRVLDQGSGAPWVAIRLDSTGVNFASEVAPTNHIIWSRDAPDGWFAHILTTDRTGTESRTQLKMERVKHK